MHGLDETVAELAAQLVDIDMIVLLSMVVEPP